MSYKTFSAVIHKEGLWYVAECPEVGSVSQGETIERAILNLREATELYLEESNSNPSERAMMTTFEVAVNA